MRKHDSKLKNFKWNDHSSKIPNKQLPRNKECDDLRLGKNNSMTEGRKKEVCEKELSMAKLSKKVFFCLAHYNPYFKENS